MNSEPERSKNHYIHHINYNRRERMVGLFVFSAVVLILALIILGGNREYLFAQHVQLNMHVTSSAGINPGNVVTLLGTNVGTVSDLKLAHGSKIHVTLNIYKSRHDLIRSDAKVVVNRLLGLGNALIEIQPGSVDMPVMPQGALIAVEETPSLNDVILGIARIVQSADKGMLSEITEIMPQLKQTIANVQKIIAQLATGQGTLGAAVFDVGVEQEMRQVVTSGAKILTNAQGIVGVANDRLEELQPLIADAGRVMHDLQVSSQNLPEIVVELRETIALTQQSLNLLNAELQHLPGTVKQARTTLHRVDDLIQNTQSLWPFSSQSAEPENNPLLPSHSLHE